MLLLSRQRRAATLFVVVILSLLAALGGPAAPAARAAPAAPGDLDPSFAGFAGEGVTNPPGFESVLDIAVQLDGKVVVVGNTGTPNELAVARYLPSGYRDTAFGGGDGLAVFPNLFTAESVAVQADGRIVAGGQRNFDLYVARLTPSGALDTSFDGKGWFRDEDPQLYPLDVAVLAQPDGKIVACGDVFIDGDFHFAVTRYNEYGARDNSFSGDGKLTISFGEREYCEDVAQYGSGGLVVAGHRFDDGLFGGEDFAVARLGAAGDLIDDFDGDGKLTSDFGGDEEGRAVIVQPDGRIVVLGQRTDDRGGSVLARYLPNGTLDPDFGSGGKAAVPVDDLSVLALAPDGTLLLAGSHLSPDFDRKLAIWRLNADGTPDTSFDGDGAAWLDLGARDEANAVAVLPDGRILAGGQSGGDAVLLRLWPDGTLDASGKQTHAVHDAYRAAPLFPPGSDVTFAALALPHSGYLVVAGEVAQPDQGRSAAFVTRFDATGQVDQSFAGRGAAFVTDGMRSGARAVAAQPDGKIVIAGYSDWGASWPSDFMVARYHSDGSPDTGFGGSNTHIRHLNFASGEDAATALALAPDGKIVAAGWAWNGTTHVWGVARLNADGSPDTGFDQDGKVFVDLGPGSTAHAVLVQPDGKIVVAGRTAADDFAVARLLEDGQLDGGFGLAGAAVTDMGGMDNVAALALGPDGTLYAGGYSWRGGQDDMALAQYTPAGQLAVCPSGETCPHWPTGKRFVNIGGSDSAYALALRDDGQLLAAGCSDAHFAAAQVSVTDAEAAPLVFQTGFAGHFNCAFSAAFTGSTQSWIVMAGVTWQGTNGNIALARFETTPEGEAPTPTPTPEPTPEPGSGGYRVFLPGVGVAP